MPLFTCQVVTECGGSVKERGKKTCVCVLSLPASDEQSVLYLGHQLKVKAVL